MKLNKKIAENFYNEFEERGYFVIRNVVKKNILKKIMNEIKVAKKVDVYLDQKKNIRRIERIFNKGSKLREINNKFIKILGKIFQTEYLIFKDKYNAKPPGGEGFYAHYDGVFKFKDKNGNIKNGWYEYGDKFINILLAIDKSNKRNGALEISKADKGSFEELLINTKNNGTPDILKSFEKKKKFRLFKLNEGDVIVFSNTCAHRSKKNMSNFDRRSLYYTYLPKKNGSKYKMYFFDKKNSKNKNNKSLTGEI